MKKRLISLLVALCMAVTLLPVSALTAWAEGGDQLRIVDGYPVGSGGEGWSYDGTTLDLHPASSTSARYYDNGSGYFSVTFTAPSAKGSTVTISPLTRLVIDENGYPVGTERGTRDYSGNGWKFENGTLTLESGNYNFSGEKNALRPLNPNVQLVVVKPDATLTGGAFKNEPTVEGAGTDTTDTFKKVILNGTGSITAVNGLASGDWGNTLYVVKTGSNTITASKPILDINRYVLESDDFLYPDSSNKSTISLNIEYLENINFIASDEDIVLNQASYDLPLEMANDGTPIINDNAPYDGGGGYYNYYGDGWYVQKSSDGKNLDAYLTGEKTYNFRYTDPVKKPASWMQ